MIRLYLIAYTDKTGILEETFKSLNIEIIPVRILNQWLTHIVLSD